MTRLKNFLRPQHDAMRREVLLARILNVSHVTVREFRLKLLITLEICILNTLIWRFPAWCGRTYELKRALI
jgi:hypothetical protein